MDKEQQALNEIKTLWDEAKGRGKGGVVMAYSAFIAKAEKGGLEAAISHRVSISDAARVMVAMSEKVPLGDIPVSEATGGIMQVLDENGIDRPKVYGYDGYLFPTKAEPRR